MEKFGGWATILLLIGAICTVIGTIVSSISQTNQANKIAQLAESNATKSDEIARYAKAAATTSDEIAVYAKANALKSDELASLAQKSSAKSDEIADYAKTNAAKSEELASLAQTNATKSDEIARLTKVNADMMTGGDSFCFLRANPGKSGKVYLSASQHGNYPIYDVTAYVIDFSEANTTRDPQIGNLSGTNYHVTIGNVSKTAWIDRSVGELPMPAQGNLRYEVMIEARNGDVAEEITGTRDDTGQWHINLVVKRHDPATNQTVTLYEEKDSQKYFTTPQAPPVPISAPLKPVLRQHKQKKPTN